MQLTGPVANTGRYYKDALSVADRRYVMATGAIVREGTARELESDPEVQRAYLGEL